jgi:hypothetical protein
MRRPYDIAATMNMQNGRASDCLLNGPENDQLDIGITRGTRNYCGFDRPKKDCP